MTDPQKRCARCDQPIPQAWAHTHTPDGRCEHANCDHYRRCVEDGLLYPGGTVPPGTAAKLAAHLPISGGLLADAVSLQSGLAAAYREALGWEQLPEAERQRLLADHETRQAQQRADRAQERAATPVTPLTVETLTAALGLTDEEAAHRVQPYCDCYAGPDGLERCEHARDLGLSL